MKPKHDFDPHSVIATAPRFVDTEFVRITHLKNIFIVSDIDLNGVMNRSVTSHPVLLAKMAERRKELRMGPKISESALKIAKALREITNPRWKKFLENDESETFAYTMKPIPWREVNGPDINILDPKVQAELATYTQTEEEAVELQAAFGALNAHAWLLEHPVPLNPGMLGGLHGNPSVIVPQNDLERLECARKILYTRAAQGLLLGHELLAPLQKLLEGVVQGADHDRQQAGENAISIISAALRSLFEKPLPPKLNRSVEMTNADGSRRWVSVESATIRLAKAFVRKHERLPTKVELASMLEKIYLPCRNWKPGSSMWSDLWEAAGLKSLPKAAHGDRHR